AQAARVAAVAAPAKREPAAKETPAPAGGWVVQVAATEDRAKATELLARAKAKTAAVKNASPFTEKITKDGTVLWRARFAGFDSDAAQAACRALKRDGFNCFAARS